LIAELESAISAAAVGSRWPEPGPGCEGRLIYRTIDGGKNWTLVQAPNGLIKEHRDIARVRFLRSGITIAFLDSGADHLYSLDDGDHWQAFKLPGPAGRRQPPAVRDCQEADGDLLCSASYPYYMTSSRKQDLGFYILRIHPQGSGK